MTTLPNVLTVRVEYPEFSERLECEPIALNVVRLLQFSMFLHLAPGDLVEVTDDGLATGVEPTDGWLVEIHPQLGLDREQVNDMAVQWRQGNSVPIEVLDNGLVRVLAPTRDWVDLNITGDDRVEMVDLLRAPGDAVSMTETY